MTREQIYAALFAQIASLTQGGSPLFRTATRRVDTWENSSADEQPAVLMRQFKESPKRVTGQPTKWILDVRLLVYAHTGAQNDRTVIPTQIINPLLDAIDACLVIDNLIANTCTLGGLVTSCAIDGEIEIHQGNFGDEAVAIVPIRIVSV